MFLQSSSFVYQKELVVRLQEYLWVQAELEMLYSSTALLSISFILKERFHKGKKQRGKIPKDLILTVPKLHVPGQAATKKCSPDFSLFKGTTVTSVGYHGNYQ